MQAVKKSIDEDAETKIKSGAGPVKSWKPSWDLSSPWCCRPVYDGYKEYPSILDPDTNSNCRHLRSSAEPCRCPVTELRGED